METRGLIGLASLDRSPHNRVRPAVREREKHPGKLAHTGMDGEPAGGVRIGDREDQEYV